MNSELQLNLKVQMIYLMHDVDIMTFDGWVATLDPKTVFMRRKTKLFWEKPEYSALIGPRGPNYKKPYMFNNYSKEPSAKNLDSPYYREFSDPVKVIGYMEPYEISIYGHPMKSAMNYAMFMPSGKLRDLVAQVYPSKRNSTPIKMNSTLKKAMSVTQDLFSGYNKMFAVCDSQLQIRANLAFNLDIKMPSGLPFCTDPSTRFRAECMDRLFELADEIDASAKVHKPSEVQAPPCSISGRYYPEESTVRWALYPAAMLLVESRLLEMYNLHIYLTENSGTVPLNTGRRLRDVKNILNKITEGKKRGCTVKFRDFLRFVHPDLIDFAFSVIEKWFFTKSFETTEEDNRKVLEFIKHYFTNAPVLLPSGQLVCTEGAAMTGSQFLPIVHSITSTVVIVYCLLNQGADPTSLKGNIYCGHREAAFTVPPSFSTSKFAKDAESFGLAMNENSFKVSNSSSDLSFRGDVDGTEYDPELDYTFQPSLL